MKTIVSLSGGYGSTYNLWQLAKDTSDDITAIFVDFGYSCQGKKYTKYIKNENIQFAKNVVSWISSNIRTINFVVLDINNYRAEYSGIAQLEIINYAKINCFDKIIFSDDIKDESTPNIVLRRAILRVAATDVLISYPIRENNSTSFQCSELLPEELKNLCAPDSMTKKSLILKQNGMSETEIAQKQIDFARGAFIGEKEDWVHSNNDFGLKVFEKNFETYYPQYPKLWKD